jgi:hypothetical protein
MERSEEPNYTIFVNLKAKQPDLKKRNRKDILNRLILTDLWGKSPVVFVFLKEGKG